MDPVMHPLDWWADGGYPKVMAKTGWSLPQARREVRRTIRRYGWKPIGNAGYEELKRRIRENRALDHELV